MMDKISVKSVTKPRKRKREREKPAALFTVIDVKLPGILFNASTEYL